MKRLSIALGTLLLLIQWPLWFGHGGWFRAWDLQRQLDERLALNEAYRVRNEALSAEITSLLHGTEAIEERARSELHMVRNGETFFQFAPPAAEARASAPAGVVASTDPLQLRTE
jgi:cell division protein FtsB